MFESILGDSLTVSSVFICTAISLILGFVVATVYAIKNRFSRNVIVTLALTPAIIQAIIMMVNGSIGTGVAVMGAFSLVRFRSAPGSSKDILYIFFAMSLGIATGIGHVVFAAFFALAVCIVLVGLKFIPQSNKTQAQKRQIKITVPEDLDFETEFKETFDKFTISYCVKSIKTSDLGSLFVINYDVTLKTLASERDFINEIRVKNGNLPIVFSATPAILEDEF